MTVSKSSAVATTGGTFSEPRAGWPGAGQGGRRRRLGTSGRHRRRPSGSRRPHLPPGCLARALSRSSTEEEAQRGQEPADREHRTHGQAALEAGIVVGEAYGLTKPPSLHEAEAGGGVLSRSASRAAFVAMRPFEPGATTPRRSCPTLRRSTMLSAAYGLNTAPAIRSDHNQSSRFISCSRLRSRPEKEARPAGWPCQGALTLDRAG